MGHHIPVLWFRSGIGSCYTSFHICSMYGISTSVGKSPYVELHRSVKVRTRLGQKYGSLTANAFSSCCSACGLPPLQHRLTVPSASFAPTSPCPSKTTNHRLLWLLQRCELLGRHEQWRPASRQHPLPPCPGWYGCRCCNTTKCCQLSILWMFALNKHISGNW